MHRSHRVPALVPFVLAMALLATGYASRASRPQLPAREVSRIAIVTAYSPELKALLPRRCSPRNACLQHAPSVRVGGRSVSGPTFVNNPVYREWVWNNFWEGDGQGVDALDMESAAVAYSNAVPFIAFRSLSDLAGGGEGANEIGTFFELAADNSARFVERFVQAL